jgi:ATP-binding protein involved in chromosome partitioning
MNKPKCILVLSGKGGVGKTLMAVNLALDLRDKGKKVGLLDADFSASNSGYFLPVQGKSIELLREEFKPIEVEGIQLFSIPLILGDRSVSMTGDQYSQLLRDAASATLWDVEYLVIDLPAGFGDELKEAAKMYEDTLLGSVIVVQPAHVLDARRALQLHKDLEMPILGLIENMSYFKVHRQFEDSLPKDLVPNEDEQIIQIFGESVVDQLGTEFGVPVFGKIPLSLEIRAQVEKKQPQLKDPYDQPLLKAVDAILQAKPQKPGFLAKVKAFLKGQLDKLIIEIALSVNTDISIPDLQQKFGYPGGSVIELNIMEDGMDQAIETTEWVVNGGKLTVVEGENVAWDARIDVTFKAVKWTILQNHPMSNGNMYTFQDALRLGHMRIYGERSMVRGAFFMQRVFVELAQNAQAMARLKPLLELL